MTVPGEALILYAIWEESPAYELSLSVHPNPLEKTADVTAAVAKSDAAVPECILMIAICKTAGKDRLIDMIMVKNVSTDIYNNTLSFDGYASGDGLLVKGVIWSSLQKLTPLSVSQEQSLHF